MGFFSSSNSTTSTTNQNLDPRSQAYVDEQRRMAQEAAGYAQNGQFFTGPQTMSVEDQAKQFFNPFTDNVLNPMRAQFDRMRSGAMLSANDAATRAGAFGGSRHGIMAGVRLGEIDAAESSQIGNMMYSGWNNALTQGTAYAEQQRQLQEQQMQNGLFGRQAAMGFMNQGGGPMAMNSTTTTKTKESPSVFGTLAGIAQVAAPFFGPAGMAASAGLSMLSKRGVGAAPVAPVAPPYAGPGFTPPVGGPVQPIGGWGRGRTGQGMFR